MNNNEENIVRKMLISRVRSAVMAEKEQTFINKGFV